MTMTPTLKAVRAEADILPVWRDTPVAELLALHNLGAGARQYAHPRILVATCTEQPVALRIPAGFALGLHSAAANLKRDPFNVSWAIGIGQVSAIAIVGHTGCGMVRLRGQREEFVARMVAAAGWARPAAEQHFDHWGDLFAVDDPAAFAALEAARLRRRYPKIPVAALLYDDADQMLLQIDA
ncbi:MAG: carbonic anhydrase [Gammaproteobacteria bacterium]|nr:carbonic anhydrase [Gammaproteobacteria bacterium]